MNETDIGIAPGAGGVAPDEPILNKPTFLGNTRKFAVGNSTFRLAAAAVNPLPNIPIDAQSAILVLEAAPDAANANAVCGRFWLDGTWPNQVEGLPMYSGSVIEVITQADLQRMRIFTTDGKNHKVNVQFFSTL